MFQYANGFTCAIADDSQTVILRFVQRIPTFLPSGEIADAMEVSPVASVILDKDVTKALGKALSTLVEE